MKANEAPEKIYLFENPVSGTPDDRWLSKRSDDNDIEYIRTDAFIKKAGQWIRDNYLKYPSEDCGDTTKFVMDFRKYMKGE